MGWLDSLFGEDSSEPPEPPRIVKPRQSSRIGLIRVRRLQKACPVLAAALIEQVQVEHPSKAMVSTVKAVSTVLERASDLERSRKAQTAVELAGLEVEAQRRLDEILSKVSVLQGSVSVQERDIEELRVLFRRRREELRRIGPRRTRREATVGLLLSGLAVEKSLATLAVPVRQLLGLGLSEGVLDRELLRAARAGVVEGNADEDEAK